MKKKYFRKYFFDLDDNSRDVDKGIDALELAQQSEASLNNLLELEDKGDDELLLQWEEKNAAVKAAVRFLDILGLICAPNKRGALNKCGGL